MELQLLNFIKQNKENWKEVLQQPPYSLIVKMDLSDYKEIQDYVNNEFITVCLLGECKPWWIRFKNDEVEDDL